MDFYGKRMVNRFEQVELFSPAEYHRRIDGVRRVMKEAGVQVCLFLECAEETYDHWLLGRRFLDYVIVPEEGEVLGVLYGELNEGGLPETGGADFSRYVAQKPVDPCCDGAKIINRAPDKKIVEILAASRPERIGLVLPGSLNAALAEAIAAKLPKAELVDITLEVALFKAVKSDEELAAIRASRNAQAAVYEALPQLLRIGRSMDEVQTEVKHLLMSQGCTGVVHGGIMCFGRQDEPASFGGMAGHKIEYGDRFFSLLEANGPGHQHIAFGRHFCIGEPTKAYEKAISDAVKIHKYAVSLMKPEETTLAQIAVRTRKYCNTLGYTLRESVGWNWMHSMGAYYYEQYSLEDYTEDVPLRAGILLHCHPLVYRRFPELGPNAQEDIFILNTYHLTQNGAEDLINVPLELSVLYA